MSAKPINIQAQRIDKIIDETIHKLTILSYLTSDLFQNIQRTDEDLAAIFGPELAELLITHAELE